MLLIIILIWLFLHTRHAEAMAYDRAPRRADGTAARLPDDAANGSARSVLSR